MTVVERIRTTLLADATVASLVGVKVHPEPAPQESAPPFIVLRVISDVHLNDVSGATGKVNATVQVDAYAVRYLDAHAIAAAVHAVLGRSTSPTLLSSRIGRRDQYDDEAALHCVSSDFSTWMEA